MKNRKRRDEKHLLTRRSMIKWTLAAGAALGLPQWKTFEILAGSGGTALADEASCVATNRSVHIVAGNGGFAWFQLLWPHNDVAAAGNANFAFHAPGQQTMAQGTDRPLTLGPQAPWKNAPGARQVTALMSGNNETHTQQPNSSSTIAQGVSVFAAAAAMQTTNPTVVPVVAVDNVPFGAAAGAPQAARIGSGAQFVELFNSAASRAGGALENTEDAELFAAHYAALVSLNAASSRSTQTRALATGRKSASLLGTNLSTALMPGDDDLVRYGIGAGSPTRLRDLAETLIITAKAFGLGLTSSVILPAMRDDPHGAFNDMNNLTSTVQTLGAILDGFHADLAATQDPTCAGSTLADNTVISIHGDTPKNPLDRSGWPDGTPGNSNWTYVLGAGYLRSGWFGGILRNGNVLGWDPTTGQDAEMSSAQTAASASAAIAYAIARGDMRRVQEFYNGVDIGGVVRPTQM